MRKQRFDFTPGESWTQSDEAAIDALIARYNAAPGDHLRVTLWIERDQLAQLEQITWAIMRIRMHKDPQRCDPNFQIVSAAPLSSGSMDLIAGLDNRLPRLLFVPWARTAAAVRDLPAFQETFRPSLSGRLLERLTLVHCHTPEADLPALVETLQAGRLADCPAVEVPLEAEIASPAALCDRVAELWTACPELTRSLGLFPDGYVKHFYHLKELWHLGQLTGHAPGPDAFARVRPAGHGAREASTLAAFERRFLERHASLENYARWRPQAGGAVLEFDLDSIADTHECQSPVFLDGRWIRDRSTLRHDGDAPAQAPASPDDRVA
jgi:hypothetical protein